MTKMKNQPRRAFSKLIGKIGWCSGATLGLPIGHYVFIRRVHGNLCDVNTISSIETINQRFEIGKIHMVKNGIIYPIPTKDTTLSRFSGIDRRVIRNIPISDIQCIGHQNIKGRHHHYIQKYMK